jgi:hypothetical protein
LNTADSIDRQELAEEFRRAVEVLALRIRIRNALGEGSLEELQQALVLVHQLSNLNENRRGSHSSAISVQTNEQSILFSNSTIA